MTLTLCLHDTARSGFGSPPSPSLLRANPPSQHDSLFAFGSNQQQQYQPTQAPPPGFGGIRGSGGASQGGHQSKGALPLGSGRGLETMPEDDDTMVRAVRFVYSSMPVFQDRKAMLFADHNWSLQTKSRALPGLSTAAALFSKKDRLCW